MKIFTKLSISSNCLAFSNSGSQVLTRLRVQHELRCCRVSINSTSYPVLKQTTSVAFRPYPWAAEVVKRGLVPLNF